MSLAWVKPVIRNQWENFGGFLDGFLRFSKGEELGLFVLGQKEAFANGLPAIEDLFETAGGFGRCLEVEKFVSFSISQDFKMTWKKRWRLNTFAKEDTKILSNHGLFFVFSLSPFIYFLPGLPFFVLKLFPYKNPMFGILIDKEATTFATLTDTNPEHRTRSSPQAEVKKEAIHLCRAWKLEWN